MKKILIVDDEPANCELLKDFLNERFEGEFEVYVADNGKEAIQIVEKWLPQLVLLDIAMAGMDGLEVLKQLKPRFPEIKFIMVTANKAVSKVMESIMHDAFEYVQKPFKLDELEKKIRSAF
jgi:CheY-like chemotaxis protein